MLRTRITIINFFISMIIFSAIALPAASLSIAKQRKLFLQAEQALKKGNISLFKQYKKKLTNYPLIPYLEYAELQRKITKASQQEYTNFMDKYGEDPLGTQMHNLWLNTQSALKNWQSFVDSYKLIKDTGLQCDYLYARYQTKLPVKKTDILNIWLHDKSRPKRCNKLFNYWGRQGGLTKSSIWQRIKLAIQSKNYRLAKYLSKNLKYTEREKVNLWIKVAKKPNTILKHHLFKGKHPAYTEMLIFGLTKLARSDPKKTIKTWQKLSKIYKFNDRHWAIVVREIGLSLALQKHSEAYKWLSKVPDKYLNTTIREWKIRAALTDGNWKFVLKDITNLPDDLRKQSKWQYWQARSLEILGNTLKSQEILNEISKERNYYGFLANMHLTRPLKMNNNISVVSLNQINKLKNLPAIQRATELLNLNRKRRAQVEWQYSLLKMNEQQKQAAAKLATNLNMHNWSILALAKANNRNNLNLRFPVAYKKRIIHEAKNNRIDPAMILAVTRQESAFVTNARSVHGALGLMQIIPTTAREVASKAKIPLRQTKQLFHPDTNIRIGSKYLKMMLNNYQHNPVLAMAAYDAGPGRIRKWLPKNNMPADIWIDTIPYAETRNYVKNVLTYMMIYQRLLGKEPKLSSQMPIIYS